MSDHDFIRDFLAKRSDQPVLRAQRPAPPLLESRERDRITLAPRRLKAQTYGTASDLLPPYDERRAPYAHMTEVRPGQQWRDSLSSSLSKPNRHRTSDDGEPGLSSPNDQDFA